MARVRWTVAEASKKWGVGHTTILRWIKSGRLPAASWEKVQETRGAVYFIRESRRPDFGEAAFAPIPYVPRKAENVERQPIEEQEGYAPEEEEPEDSPTDTGDDEDDDFDTRRYSSPDEPSLEELEAIEAEAAKPKKPRRIVMR